MKIWKKRVIVSFITLVMLAVFLYTQNNLIRTTRYDIAIERLPEAFDGYRIVQISDLHSKEFGEGQKNLIKRIKKEGPDAIFVTGDIVDGTKYNEKVALELLAKCVKLATVYYVPGNHEYWSGNYDSLREKIAALGVIILEDKVIDIKIKGQTIAFMGLMDPAGRGTDYDDTGNNNSSMKALQKLNDEIKAEVKILLSHRPELFNVYAENNIQVVFTGHAHGGQFRLPFIGGIIAPDQGILPRYDKGVFKKGNTNMVVSSGLGNSIIPQRIFNRPEIVVVTIKKE